MMIGIIGVGTDIVLGLSGTLVLPVGPLPHQKRIDR
jgi:hypothetical protein